MKEEIFVGTRSTGLGDVLLLTAVCKHIKDKRIIVNLLPCCEKFKFLFDNIADEVIFTHQPIQTPDVGLGHYAQTKCRSVGYYGDDYVPKIIFNNKNYDLEINETLSKLKNPVILKLGCSKNWKHVREFPVEYWQNYFKDKNYDLIQFELSENPFFYPDAIKFIDAPLEKQTAYYQAVKKYIGVDTGDLHLMLALDGTVEAHVPKHGANYSYRDWHYENNRIKYIHVE